MPPGEYGDFLNFGWQRADQVDARDRKQLADLLEAQLGLSAGDDRADGFDRDHPTLAQHGPRRRAAYRRRAMRLL